MKLIIDYMDDETLELENVTSYEVINHVLKVYRKITTYGDTICLGNFPIFNIRCYRGVE